MNRVQKTILYGLLNLICWQCLGGEISFVPGSRRFEYLTIRDGLSQNTVNGILQDSQGFMWFGTQDGLNRYDGYSFKTYSNDPGVRGSLMASGIYTLCEPVRGTLWIGTTQGVCTFDSHTGFFSLVGQASPYHQQFRNLAFPALIKDHLGRMWLGSTGGGLFCYDGQKKTYTQYDLPATHGDELANARRINVLMEDGQGNIWLGCEAIGLLCLQKNATTIKHISTLLDVHEEWANSSVRALLCDKNGTLWVGTENYGLIRLLQATLPGKARVTRYTHHSEDGYSLPNNFVRVLYQDRRGAIWVGTMGGGMARIAEETTDKQKNIRFLLYADNTESMDGFPGNNILSMLEDEAGTLWIGTRNAGLKLLHANLSNFLTFRRQRNESEGLHHSVIWNITPEKNGGVWLATDGALYRFDLGSKTITAVPFDHEPRAQRFYANLLSLCDDQQGNLWIATDGGGLFKYQKKTQKTFNYRYSPDDAHSITNNSLRCVLEDSFGVLWVGLNEGGLCAVYPQDREKMKFTRYYNIPFDFSSLSHNRVFALYEDRAGVIWIGTMGGGLNRFERETGRFTHFRKQTEEVDSLNDDIVISMYSDSLGLLWVGTSCGLNVYDARTSHWLHYTTRDGLANNVIYAILEENPPPGATCGHIWVSTNKGLSRFNRTTKQFRNYDYADGLQSNEFAIGSGVKTQNGWFLFGGINGLNLFDPYAIRDNSYVPPVVLTDFKISSQGYEMAPAGFVAKKQVTLTYPQHSFTVEFAALNFINPEKNQYKYQLEGFDSEWTLLRKREPVTYTNVPPGQYRFRVLASNNDGIWNSNGAWINIKITRPFWHSPWFWGSIVFVLLVLVMLFLCSRMAGIFANKR